MMNSDAIESRPIVPVCAAVIVKGGRVLVGRRRREGADPGKWEFPGGKLFPGEDLRVCLARELDEEFGVRAEVGGLYDAVNHAYERHNVLVIFYRVDIPDGDLVSHDHDMILWAGPDEIAYLDFLEADRPVAHRLINELRDS